SAVLAFRSKPRRLAPVWSRSPPCGSSRVGSRPATTKRPEQVCPPAMSFWIMAARAISGGQSSLLRTRKVLGSAVHSNSKNSREIRLSAGSITSPSLFTTHEIVHGGKRPHHGGLCQTTHPGHHGQHLRHGSRRAAHRSQRGHRVLLPALVLQPDAG